MSNRMETWNPTFMNPMLSEAQTLIGRIHQIFGDGNGRSQALTEKEAADLKTRFPDSSIAQESEQKIIYYSAMHINRLYDSSSLSDSNFKKVIEGQETNFTTEALREIRKQCVDKVATWAESSLGISDPSHIARIKLCTDCRELRREISQAAGREMSDAEETAIYQIYYKEMDLVKPTPSNSKTHVFSNDEKLEMATSDMQILFIVAREFIINGYGAALIEARDQQLAQDIKDFFKKNARQLTHLRKDNIMTTDIFNKLTAN
jgi:hypothetical protein